MPQSRGKPYNPLNLDFLNIGSHVRMLHCLGRGLVPTDDGLRVSGKVLFRVSADPDPQMWEIQRSKSLIQSKN